MRIFLFSLAATRGFLPLRIHDGGSILQKRSLAHLLNALFLRARGELSRTRLLGTSLNKGSEDALCFIKWQHLRDRTMYGEKEDRYGRPECSHGPRSARRP